MEWFVKLPMLTQVSLVVGTLIISIVFLVLAFRYRLRLSGKGISVQTGVLPEQKKQSPHIGCTHAADALSGLSSLWDIFEEKADLKFRYFVRRQMDIAESSIDLMQAKFVKVYTGILARKGFADPVHAESFRAYQNVLNVWECMIQKRVRDYIRTNGFAEKTEKDMNHYIETRANDLIGYTTEIFNSIYHHTIDIPRSELYDANREIFNELRQIIRTMFLDCRSIALDIQRRIDGLDTERDAIFARFVQD